MDAHVAPPTLKVPAVKVRVVAVSKNVLGSNVPAVSVKALELEPVTVILLPRVTTPLVLLIISAPFVAVLVFKVPDSI